MDGWLIATIQLDSRGKALTSSRLFGVIWGWVPSTRRAHAAVYGGLLARVPPRRTALWETQWGQLNSQWLLLAFTLAASLAGYASVHPVLVTNSGPPFGGPSLAVPVRASAGFRIVTWLILPVVICLSQRLSHACLSISNYTVKLRMAH